MEVQSKVTFARLTIYNPTRARRARLLGQYGLPSSPKADAREKALGEINCNGVLIHKTTRARRARSLLRPQWAAFFSQGRDAREKALCRINYEWNFPYMVSGKHTMCARSLGHPVLI